MSRVTEYALTVFIVVSLVLVGGYLVTEKIADTFDNYANALAKAERAE